MEARCPSVTSQLRSGVFQRSAQAATWNGFRPGEGEVPPVAECWRQSILAPTLALSQKAIVHRWAWREKDCGGKEKKQTVLNIGEQCKKRP